MILYNLKLAYGSGVKLAEPVLMANLAVTSANNETFITNVMSNTVRIIVMVMIIIIIIIINTIGFCKQ